MAANLIDIVGGPADGKRISRPPCPTLNVPTGTGGEFVYTLRRCRNASGNLVEVLAPAGRLINPEWLAANKLTN
jgi:hypothetical protein